MSLRVVAGWLDLSSSSIVCQLDDGETRVICTIVRQALRDMGDYHQLSGSEEAIFSEMLPEIERLATEKFRPASSMKTAGLALGPPTCCATFDPGLNETVLKRLR